MYNSFFILPTALLLCLKSLYSQDVYHRNESADVQNYIFNLTLNDDTNEIMGEARVTVNFTNLTDRFALDLVGKTNTYGMAVTDVFEGDKKADYTFSNNKILISPTLDGPKTKTFMIKYHGVPEMGLVIDTTKFGQRSFFGDNWPNLARHWLPCVDHPYDKASVEFRITAPDHYDVVATGKEVEESSLGNGYKLTRYSEPAPVAMKVVTIGVTKFATELLGMVNGIPVTAWVYPENRLEGFSDYAISTNVLKYFIDHIGPYSYAKLANVQAKTQWGGLENAGAISYFENSVTGKNTVEPLIAHEIAHQWFGDSASENSWNHVWLSEGFATYFSILYQEAVYGNKKRKELLDNDRKKVIEYYGSNPMPIVDNSILDPMKVLSTNTYQKASWVLNMLRHKLGDGVFWKGIRAYYQKYQNSNAMTDDFRAVMEEVSGENLKEFFEQWIFTKGHPVLKWNWGYQKGKLRVTVEQLQPQHIFRFPLEIGVVNGDAMKIETLEISSKSKTFELTSPIQPNAIILDPEFWLLFEEK